MSALDVLKYSNSIGLDLGSLNRFPVEVVRRLYAHIYPSAKVVPERHMTIIIIRVHFDQEDRRELYTTLVRKFLGEL